MEGELQSFVGCSPNPEDVGKRIESPIEDPSGLEATGRTGPEVDEELMANAPVSSSTGREDSHR